MKKIEIFLSGYGGEVVLGTVEKKVFEYFQDNEIDINEFSNDWNNELSVPEDMQPFQPGEWHECDDISHHWGVEMHECCRVVVTDIDTGNIIFECNLDSTSLENAGIESNCTEEIYGEYFPGKVVFRGQSVEKGTFFYVRTEIEEDFDPDKLELAYSDIDGWELCHSIKYNNIELYDEGADTVGKSIDFAMTYIKEHFGVEEC
jgi:leucine-rich repeat protein SHOC2